MLKMTVSDEELAPRLTITGASTRFSALRGAGTTTVNSLLVAASTSAGSSPKKTWFPPGFVSNPRPFTTMRSPGTPARGTASETSGRRPRYISNDFEALPPTLTTTGTLCPSTTTGSLGTRKRTRPPAFSSMVAGTPATVSTTPCAGTLAPTSTTVLPGSATSGSSAVMRSAPGGPWSSTVPGAPGDAPPPGPPRINHNPPATRASTTTATPPNRTTFDGGPLGGLGAAGARLRARRFSFGSAGASISESSSMTIASDAERSGAMEGRSGA
jgi:hypothetical protein